VHPFFLGTRARATSFGFACFGLATVAPPGIHGFGAFMLSPPGVPIVGLALVMLGISVEETGTLRRIRIAAAIRLLAFALAIAAAVWATALGAWSRELATMGAVLYGLGIAGATLGFLHDKALLADVRHGQDLRLEGISADAVTLRAGDRDVSVPSSSLRGATMAKSDVGRAVFVLVRSRNDVVGAVDRLPWVSAGRDGDAFVLTEHQAGLDADVLATRLSEAAAAAEVRGYR